MQDLTVPISTFAGDEGKTAAYWLGLEGQLEDGAVRGHILRGGGNFVARRIVLRAGGDAAAVVVSAVLPARVEVPAALIHDTELRFRSGAELDVELATLAASLAAEARALREEALRRLRTIEIDWATPNAAFLDSRGDAGHLTLKGAAKLRLAAIVGGPDQDVLAGAALAEFSVQSSIVLAFPGPPAINIARHYAVVCRIRLDAAATLAIGLDDLNFAMPEIALPSLDLSTLPLSLAFPSLANPFPGLAGAFESLHANSVTTLVSDPPSPCLNIRRSGGAFQWALAREPFTDEADWTAPAAKLAKLGATITFKVPGSPTATISDVKVADAGAHSVFEAALSPSVSWPVKGSRRMGPLTIACPDGNVTVTPQEPFDIAGQQHAAGGQRVLLAKFTFKSLSISLADDPATFIALDGEIDITPAGARVVKLGIVQPYSLKLVERIASLVPNGRVLQLFGHIEAPHLEGLKRLLEVLGKLAAALAKATVFVTDAVVDVVRYAADLLGKALVTVAEFIGDAIAALANLLKTETLAPSVDIEVRVGLDPIELRQILITLRGGQSGKAGRSLEALGISLTIPTDWQPGLLIDLVGRPGVYVVVTRGPHPGQPFVQLQTDLWLEKAEAGTVTPIRDVSGTDGERSAQQRLITIAATPKDPQLPLVLVLAGLSRGKPVFFERVTSRTQSREVLNVPGLKTEVVDGPFAYEKLSADSIDFDLKFEPDRILPLLGMGEPGTESAQPGKDKSFLDKLQDSLGQVVSIKSFLPPKVKPSEDHTEIETGLVLDIRAAGVHTEATLGLSLSLDTLHVRLSGPTNLKMRSRRIEQKALGLTWIVEQKDEKERQSDAEVEMFELVFSGGESALQLNADKAQMEVRFEGLSADGKGISFKVSRFYVGRGGVDLDAQVTNRAVRLNGVDVPFEFTTGKLAIRGSKLTEAVIAGRGMLPPKLIGEAKCSITLAFGQDASGIVLQSGKVEIDKKGEPIVCDATRFTLTITDLDIGIVKDTGYHFYFLVSGSLRFTPKSGEFEDGLLKYLSDVEMNLDRVPLAGDAKVLARHISFQKTLNPKKTFPLFNLFEFELRGFGFHPASPKFDGDPAVNISGQIRFAQIGDVMQPSIDFHGLWLAGPKQGESLPRIKADGLGVDLQLSGSVKISGSVLAVDPDTRTVEGSRFAPPGYDTYGFLGEGTVDIPGWGVMQASFGFLEVQETGADPSTRRKAFFLYLQRNQLAIEIPTPFWTFYIRELGFGLGFRYTLAGIKDAESAHSPAQLIRILDDVSKRQGDLARFSAWRPDPGGDKFTLAMRAAIQAYPAQQKYDEESEKAANNPFFFDLVAALRSDLTFLMSARGWLGVNYYDFQRNPEGMRENPGFRGYLYISAPRSEVLARVIGDSKGYIGERLPGLRKNEILRKAVQSVDWSATMYIRPGLFHFEMGWPNQLVVRLADSERMKVTVRGGMIFRAAEDGLLWAYNIEADAFLAFGGSTGGSTGVSVEATLVAYFTARVLAYISSRFQGSLVYGLIALDANLAFRVRAWMEVDLGFTSFTISIAFSFSIQLSAAVELAITTEGVGGRVAARVAVSAFGCTLGVGVGFTFNDNQLELARARVQRFMALSIAADEPDASPATAAKSSNERLTADAEHAQAQPNQGELQKPAKQPGAPARVAAAPTAAAPAAAAPLPTAPNRQRSAFGRRINPTDFWLVLRVAECAPGGDALPHGEHDPVFVYAMLVPKEVRPDLVAAQPYEPTRTDDPHNKPYENCRGGFYSSPCQKDYDWHDLPHAQKEDLGKRSETQWTHRLAKVPKDSPIQRFQPVPGAWVALDEGISEYKTVDVPARWNSLIPVEGKSTTGKAIDFTLAQLFDECFLSDTQWLEYDGVPPWREATGAAEPFYPRAHAVPERAPRNRDMRAAALDTAQRQQATLGIVYPFDESAYQARSTTLTMFVDQFVELARTGRQPPDETRAHVTDLGLVFYGLADSIVNTLSTLRVVKSDSEHAEEQGEIEVLNPPSEWFVRRDPALESARQEVAIDGVKLDWDLKLRWQGDTDSADARADPAQFLQYYEIVRTIEGKEFTPQVFRVKPASTVGGLDAGGRMSLTATEWQFTDTLGPETGVTATERRALLPAADEVSGIEALKAWQTAFEDASEVTLTYSVTCVDTAGTPGLPKTFTVDIQRPATQARSAEAELHFIQYVTGDEGGRAEGTQGSTKRPTDLDLYIAIRDPAWQGGDATFKVGDREFTMSRRYRLIADPEDLQPAGHYGSDGQTERVRRAPSATSLDITTADEAWLEFARSETIDVANERTPKRQVSEVKDVEQDDDARKRFPLWAKLVSATDAAKTQLPVIAVDRDAYEKFVEALWRRPDSGERVAVRFKLATLIVVTEKARTRTAAATPLSPFVSKRVAVPAQLTLKRLVTPEAGWHPVISMRPESFEWTTDLRFPPLGTKQVAADSGFARFRAPAIDASLAAWQTVADIPDAERRVLTTISFDALPDWARGGDDHPVDPAYQPMHRSAISAFDLYEMDIDELAPLDTADAHFEMDIDKPAPLDTARPHFASDAMAWSRARKVASVQLLSREAASLTPHLNSNWQGWRAHYPSETYRLTRPARADASSPTRAPWYSSRESTPRFPVRHPRLRFFPVAPEETIAEVMARGRPQFIDIELTPALVESWPEFRSIRPTLHDVRVFEDGDGANGGAKDHANDDANDDEHGHLLSSRFVYAQVNGRAATRFKLKTLHEQPERFSVDDVRNLLLCVGWDPFADKSAALDAWRRNPAAFGTAGVTVTARSLHPESPETPDGTSVDVKVDVDVDFTSPLHPALEEVLGELSLAWDQGLVYRHYKVMVQPAPKVDATELATFIASTPAAADPYGWGVLQALGLSATIRLFDAAKDAFAPPDRLLDRLERVAGSVFARWRSKLGDDCLGQTFAELLLKPGADRVAAPFDAVVDRATVQQAKRMQSDDLLALVQLSLRPAPRMEWGYERLKFAWKNAAPDDPDDPDDESRAPRRETRADGTVLVTTTTKRVRGYWLAIERSVPAADATVEFDVALESSGGITSVAASAPTAMLAIAAPRKRSRSGAVSGVPPVALVWRASVRSAAAGISVKLVVERETVVTTRDENAGATLPAKVTRDFDEKVVLWPPTANDYMDVVPSKPAEPKPEPDHILYPGQFEDRPDVFGRFGEQSIEAWSTALGVDAPDNPLWSLLHHLVAVAPANFKLPSPFTESSGPIPVGAYLPWAQRLLDHAAAPGVDPQRVAVALAAPDKATPWRLAADRDGRINLSFVHNDRWAHTRSYAVKPTSRYQHLYQAAGRFAIHDVDRLVTRDLLPSSAAPVTKREMGYGVSLSRRTERIEPPVILGAKQRGVGDAATWEIVVARHGEESLAMSNRSLFARLERPAAMLAFARAYRMPDWPRRLQQEIKDVIDCATSPERVATVPLPAPHEWPTFTGADVGVVEGEYPSLWKGADIWRVTPIPPHYRMVAFAAARAGIVTSDIVTAIVDDLPRRNLTRSDDEAKKLLGCPTLCLVRREPGTSALLSLSHRLVSHADLTTDVGQRWIGQSPRDVAWWPDPDVVYSIVRRTPTDLAPRDNPQKRLFAEEEDVEIRLVPQAAENTDTSRIAPVVWRARGPRFKAFPYEFDANEGHVKSDQHGTAPFRTFTLRTELARRSESVRVRTLLSNAEEGTADQRQAFNQAANRVAMIAEATAGRLMLEVWDKPTDRQRAEIAKSAHPVVGARFDALAEVAAAIAIDPLRTLLPDEESGSEAEQREFNEKAAEFAAVTVTHRARFDCPPDDGEVDAHYKQRLIEYPDALDAYADAHLASKTHRWMGPELAAHARTLAARLRARIADKPTDLPKNWRESVFTIDPCPVAWPRDVAVDPGYPGSFTLQAPEWDAAVTLVVWDAPTDAEAKAVRDTHHVATGGGRLWRYAKRVLLGDADSLTLHAVDGRARVPDEASAPHPGVVDCKIHLPDWMPPSQDNSEAPQP